MTRRRSARLMDAMRAAVAVTLPLSMTAVAAAQNVDTAHRLCATAGNAQPPVYLTMTTSGLSRLELSPSVPGGIAQIAVSREEIATLCAEGLDVRYREPRLLPAAFSIVRRRGAVYGNLWSAATTPDGATAQWLMFDVQSAAYAGQGEHAPIALFLDAQRLAATPPAIVGNGMVFGEVERAPNGCGGPSSPGAPFFNTEVEAFWSSGNHLWSSTCGNRTLSDGPTYSIVLRATADGWVAFDNASGGTGIAAPPAVYTPAQRPPLTATNGGVLMASTNFCPACGDFSLYFSSVDIGWSIDTPVEPLPDSPNPLSADADSLTFSAQTFASRAPLQQVTFTNNRSTAWDVQFDVKASNAPHCGGIVQTPLCAQEIDQEQRSFIVSDSGCHAIPPRGQCTVSIAFEPQGSFKLEASLEYHVANAYAVAVSLEGIGLPEPTLPGTVLAVEYFNPALGHYFRHHTACRNRGARQRIDRRLDSHGTMVLGLSGEWKCVGQPQSGLPFLRPSGSRSRFAFLLGVSGRVRRSTRSVCERLDPRNVGPVRHRSAGPERWHLCRGHRAGLPAI
jgi:hypothetical protein